MHVRCFDWFYAWNEFCTSSSDRLIEYEQVYLINHDFVVFPLVVPLYKLL